MYQSNRADMSPAWLLLLLLLLPALHPPPSTAHFFVKGVQSVQCVETLCLM
jgi:hypothetical protein